MTKKQLEQYLDLQAEAKDIRRRIRKVENQLWSISNGGTVIDTVHGTRADNTYGTIKIEGFPSAAYNKKTDELLRRKKQLKNIEEKLEKQLAEIHDFIETIEDSKTRLIIRCRFEDGLSWYDVADRVGGKATSESCRKHYERFFEKN